MAAGVVKDIDEKFCQCYICLEQFKEPKLLPCLDRFCKNCLAEVIQQNQGSLPCPVCREECIVPEEGSEGFKTDFYMKNIIEYIQLQKSMEDNHMQECYGCSKILRVSAYCFKCNDFLCEACHQFHVTSNITKDHRPHTLEIEDMSSTRLSLDKLASIKGAPRCYTHSEKLSELCCKTCSNTPICIACTYGNHKGHDFCEATAIANEERQKLEHKLASLVSYEEEFLKRPKNIGKIKADIKCEVSEKKKYLQSKYFEKNGKIEENLEHLKKESELQKMKKENELKTELKLLQTKMENEIQQVKEKYIKRCDKMRKKAKTELEIIQSEYNRQTSSLQKTISALDTSCKEAIESLAKQEQQNTQKVQAILDHFDSTLKRLKNLKLTASSILDSKNDWTAVQCIPDINAAAQPLIEDMIRQFPELESMTKINLNVLPSTFPDVPVSITNRESVVDIEQITAKCWSICDVRCSQGGSIVLTGNADSANSHITVIDEEGKVIREWVKGSIIRNMTFSRPDRFCDFLSEHKIATTCDTNEVGVFDIRGGSYIKKDISNLTADWPVERGVTCIAADPVIKHIIVGSWEGPELCMFDDRINYVRTLMLPEPLTGADSILISSTNLLVCCFEAQKAIAMSMDGHNGETLFEFSTPFDDGRNWYPIDVCKDTKGLIYILWTDESVKGIGVHVIAQYGQNNTDVLATKMVDNNAISLQTIKDNHLERLLVVTESSGKMYQYDLIPQL